MSMDSSNRILTRCAVGPVLARVAACLLLALLTQFGCGPGRTGRVGDEKKSRKDSDKIKVEAYLFDAKLRRDGKLNSFRLDVYQTDTQLGLTGRGYLGKGALKGWMRSDSLKVFFPSTNEYLYEPTSEILRAMECTFVMPEIDLTALFKRLPDEILFDPAVTVEVDYFNPKRPRFALFVPDCLWRIDLVYDKKQPGWRIRSFEFADGKGNRLTAKRREYRKSARVRARLLEAPVPDDAFRIYP